MLNKIITKYYKYKLKKASDNVCEAYHHYNCWCGKAAK